MKKVFLTLIALLVLSACEEPVPDGYIKIKNDLQGDEFSVLQVSGGGAFYTLKSGQRILMPKGVTSLTFRYEGPKDTREYFVECPSRLKSGIAIKLIDVHSNRIDGGCEVVSVNKTPRER